MQVIVCEAGNPTPNLTHLEFGMQAIIDLKLLFCKRKQSIFKVKIRFHNTHLVNILQNKGCLMLHRVPVNQTKTI